MFTADDFVNDTRLVLKADRVSKRFCRNLKRSMYYGTLDLGRNLLGLRTQVNGLRRDEFWAVEDVSLELRRGEAVGILGVNGSGKSTLLRLLAGIFPLDRGQIFVKGSIGSLIALGAGFHPHMTGRENIHLNGAILGMTRRELNEKLPSILEFAEIYDFIDAPVSTYSSGMSIRLGFSIAIHSIPQLLLVDEVLAVGDVNFQKKCFEKILDLRQSGVSIILVSHSISLLERMCETGLLLHHGRSLFAGNIRECVKAYMDLIHQENLGKDEAKKMTAGRAPVTAGVGNVTFSDVRVYQQGGDPDKPEIEFGRTICIEFKYRFREKLSDEHQLRLGIRTHEGRDVQKMFFHECRFADGQLYPNEKLIKLEKEGTATVRILNPRLFPQSFRLDVAISPMKKDYHEGALANAAVFRIVEPKDRQLYFEYGVMSITEFECDIALT